VLLAFEQKLSQNILI